MSVKLEKPTIPAGIPVDDMLDGQIAEIMYHPEHDAIGLVVQRYLSTLIVLGMDSVLSYPYCFGGCSSIRVRLLEDGEAFTVVENEG